MSEGAPLTVAIKRLAHGAGLDLPAYATPSSAGIDVAAAVADWRLDGVAEQKLKKRAGGEPPKLKFAENPDILATLSQLAEGRPRLVVGFAAETENLIENAEAKRRRKGCDWIVANDVSAAGGGFGGDSNLVHLIAGDQVEDWPRMSKRDVAERLAARIAEHFNGTAG